MQMYRPLRILFVNHPLRRGMRAAHFYRAGRLGAAMRNKLSERRTR